MNLVADLLWLADRWVEELCSSQPTASRKTLSSRATKDAKLFDRIERGSPVGIPLFERCVGFLGESANWPDGIIPPDVEERLVLMRAPITVGIKAAQSSAGTAE